MIFDIHEIFEDAAEMAGTELRTGYDFKSARRSLALLLREWANRGYNLYSIVEDTIPLVQGQTDYALPVDTIDVTDCAIRENPNTPQQFDISLARVTLTEYFDTPNKLTQARPSQFIVRRTTTPTLVVWAAPDRAYTLYYSRLAMVDEPSVGGELPALPDRWIPAMTAGLALRLAMKRPALADRVAGLEGAYKEMLMLAQDEDRDRAPLRFTPYRSAR
jgi:hypothetical protein